jgi:hypothetical protein
MDGRRPSGVECFRSVRNELPPKSCRWWAGGASNGSLLQLSTPKEKDGQPPSLSRPGTSARLATTATSRSPRTTTLHESSLKQMVALLEASTARQSEALRERFDELEKHLISRFEQGLKAFRAEHVQPLAAHVTTLGSKLGSRSPAARTLGRTLGLRRMFASHEWVGACRDAIRREHTA